MFVTHQFKYIGVSRIFERGGDRFGASCNTRGSGNALPGNFEISKLSNTTAKLSQICNINFSFLPHDKVNKSESKRSLDKNKIVHIHG